MNYYANSLQKAKIFFFSTCSPNVDFGSRAYVGCWLGYLIYSWTDRGSFPGRAKQLFVPKIAPEIHSRSRGRV